MTSEQREAMELAKEFTKMDFSNKMGWTGYYDTELKELSQAIDTVLSLIKENQKQLEKKDKQIDLMARAIDNYDSQLEINTFKDKEHIKQYFADLVEKE